MDKLARGASGLRHLRWAREIYATLAAHVADSELGHERRSILEKELTRLDGRIQTLSSAVKGYRDFLERERVKYRGAIRASRLVDETGMPPFDRQRRADTAFQREALPKQRALKATLEIAIAELRGHLEEMDSRIAAATTEKLLDNLYPPLMSDRSRVADEPDDDDDASGIEN